MSAFDAAEQALLDLVFLATAWANVADNAATSALTNLHASLHTADPGESGNLSTNEATYTSYARQNVARSGAGFARTGSTINPVADVVFPEGSGGSGTITHFALGKTGGGSAEGFVSGTFTPNISSGLNITPKLKSTTAITID